MGPARAAQPNEPIPSLTGRRQTPPSVLESDLTDCAGLSHHRRHRRHLRNGDFFLAIFPTSPVFLKTGQSSNYVIINSRSWSQPILTFSRQNKNILIEPRSEHILEQVGINQAYHYIIAKQAQRIYRQPNPIRSRPDPNILNGIEPTKFS